ncbi:XK-related protein 2 [Lates japonicus]|uniref:XK-related protein 2 n=1 Tax=Lates japonicus TaxID=270547 RepID=A0AAD3NFY5_LATJO|nr:XK-related protein 2 [Lates japonicus]
MPNFADLATTAQRLRADRCCGFVDFNFGDQQTVITCYGPARRSSGRSPDRDPGVPSVAENGSCWWSITADRRPRVVLATVLTAPSSSPPPCLQHVPQNRGCNLDGFHHRLHAAPAVPIQLTLTFIQDLVGTGPGLLHLLLPGPVIRWVEGGQKEVSRDVTISRKISLKKGQDAHGVEIGQSERCYTHRNASNARRSFRHFCSTPTGFFCSSRPGHPDPIRTITGRLRLAAYLCMIAVERLGDSTGSRPWSSSQHGATHWVIPAGIANLPSSLPGPSSGPSAR